MVWCVSEWIKPKYSCLFSLYVSLFIVDWSPSLIIFSSFRDYWRYFSHYIYLFSFSTLNILWFDYSINSDPSSQHSADFQAQQIQHLVLHEVTADCDALEWIPSVNNWWFSMKTAWEGIEEKENLLVCCIIIYSKASFICWLVWLNHLTIRYLLS